MLIRREDCWHLPAQAAASVLPQMDKLCETCHSSKAGKTETNSLGSPTGKVRVLKAQINLSSPCMKLGVRGCFPDCLALNHGQGLWWEGILNLPTSFTEAGFIVPWGAGVCLLVSDFSERESVHEWLLNSAFVEGGRLQGFLLCHIADVSLPPPRCLFSKRKSLIMCWIQLSFSFVSFHL